MTRRCRPARRTAASGRPSRRFAGATRLRQAAALGLPTSSAWRPAVRSAAAAHACAPAGCHRMQVRRVLLRRRLGLRGGRGGVQERAQLQVRRARPRGPAVQLRR